jgi:hypothetical protein
MLPTRELMPRFFKLSSWFHPSSLAIFNNLFVSRSRAATPAAVAS